MANREQFNLAMVIDWSDAKASTAAFIREIDGAIESILAKANKGGGSNAQSENAGRELARLRQEIIEVTSLMEKGFNLRINTTQINEALKEVERLAFTAGKTIRQEISTATIGGVPIGKNQFKNLYTKDIAAGFIDERKNIDAQNRGAVLLQRPAETAAEKQLEKALAVEELAADRDYIATTVFLAEARKKLAATLDAEKSINAEYLAATTRATVSAIQRETAERDALTADEEYFKATVDLAATRLFQDASEKEALAASKIYLETFAHAAASKNALAAAEQETLASSEAYIASTVDLAATRLFLAAAEQEALANSRIYLETNTRAVTVKNELAAAEQQALAGDEAYLTSTVELAIAKSALVAVETTELAAEEAYIATTVEAAVAKKQLSAITAESLAASADATAATVKEAIAKAQSAAAIDEEKAASAEYLNTTLRASLAKLQVETKDKEMLAASDLYVDTLTRAALAKARLAAVDEEVALRVQATQLASGGLFPAYNVKTRAFAPVPPGFGADAGQINANLSNFQYNNPNGGGVPPAGPRGFFGALSGQGQGPLSEFAGSRLRSTLGFAASGFVIFGIITELRDAIKATGELEKEFNIIQSILDEIGQSDSFDKIRSQIKGLSVETATPAADVARVERQLAGVFANPQTGQADYAKAAKETEAATKFAKISGESFTEIVDDFSAIAISFSNDKDIIKGGFKEIGNEALNLAQQLGVPEQEILKFTSDIAPLGASLGFTAKQLESLGAVAIQASGRPASGLSEQIGRSLSGLSDKFASLVELFASNPATQGLSKQLGLAFGAGDTPKILEILVENYSKLNAAQQANLALIVGGRREAGTFYALLQRAPQTLKALRGQFAEQPDLFDKRFESVTKSITFQFDQAKIAVQNFLITILDSGLADGLGEIANGVSGIASALAKIVDLIAPINDFFGGWPGRIIGVTLEMVALVKAWEALQRVILATKIGGALFPGGAAAQEAKQAEIAAGTYVNPNGFLGGPGGPGIRGTINKIGPGLAVTAAALAVGQLINTYQEYSKDVEGAGKQIHDAALKQLQSGASFEEVQRRAGPSRTIDDITTFVLGVKNQSANLLDAKQSADNLEKVAKLQALKDQQGNIDVNGLNKDFSRKTLSELIHDLSENPESDAVNKLADDVIKQKGGDPQTNKLFQEAAENAKKINAKDQAQADAMAALPDQIAARDQAISELQQQFDKGNTGSDALEAALKLQSDALTTAIDSTVAGGKPASDPATQKVIADRDAYLKQLETVIKARVLGPIDFAQKLRDALGQGDTLEGVTQTLDESIRAAQTLDSKGVLDAQTGTDLLFKGIEALKARRASQAKDATNKLDQARISATPIDIPPELKKLAVDIQLREPQNAGFVEGFSKATGILIKAARDHINDLLIQFGGDADAVDAVLTKEVKDFRASVIRQVLAATSKFDNLSGFANRIVGEAIASQIKRATGIGNAGINQLAQAIGVDTITAEKYIADLFVKFDGDAAQIALAIQLAELRVARNSLTMAQALAAKWSNVLGINSLAQSALDAATSKVTTVLGGVGLTAGISAGAAAGASAGAKKPDLNVTIPGSIGPEPGAAQAAADEAAKEAEARENALLDIAAAQANGDAIALANIAKQRAEITLKYAKTESERLAAFAQIIEANNQLQKALEEYAVALYDIVNAQSGDDPVVVAQHALYIANAAVAKASGPIAQAQAIATQIRAEHTLARAIQDLGDSQLDILIAMAEASDNSVEAANLALEKLRDRLANSAALGLNDTEKNSLKAQIISQEAVVRRQRISEAEESIQTSLDLGRINKQQAIAQLQGLLAFAKSQKEIDQINLEIKQLKDQLGQDFKFNLPSVLGLPTLYEARRLGQVGGNAGPGGGGSYQDNRIINLNITTGNGATARDIANEVTKAVGAPNRFSTYGSRY